MRTTAYRGEGDVASHICTYTLTLSRFMFLATFLCYSVLFYY